MRTAVFLDRDGVINVDKGYVHRIDQFEFLPGIFEFCAIARSLGYMLVVITNQAGIGRGYYTEEAFQTLTQWMFARFRDRGIPIARVYHCPFHPTAGIGIYRRDSFERKPNPGMLLRARDELGIALRCSVVIGDKESDIAAGRAAGVPHLLKLTHEPGRATASDADVVRVATLEAASHWLRHKAAGAITGG